MTPEKHWCVKVKIITKNKKFKLKIKCITIIRKRSKTVIYKISSSYSIQNLVSVTTQATNAFLILFVGVFTFLLYTFKNISYSSGPGGMGTMPKVTRGEEVGFSKKKKKVHL